MRRAGGPSGVGKSSILKMVYGNYRCDAGRIRVRHDGGETDIATHCPGKSWTRERALGYVTQFLRVVPRVAAPEHRR